MTEKKHFQDTAGFGKRSEFLIIAKMIEFGLDIYVPLVDHIGIDAVIRKRSGEFAEVQIKARSAKAKPGTEALFSVISFVPRKHYWFVFYSERLQTQWLLKAEEFEQDSSQTKSGKYKGLRYINLKAKRFQKYIIEPGDFSRIEPKQATPPEIVE